MSDHLSLCTDRLITAESLESEKDSGESSRPQGKDVASSSSGDEAEDARKYYAVVAEEEPLLQAVECRICQEEDITNNLETPCACNGSLKVLKTIPLSFL